MNEQPKSKWYWRALRWGLLGLLVLATLAGVLITEENWRGRHDWEAFRHAAEAHGDHMDLAYAIPPAVPDDQNFFAAPVFAHILAADSPGMNFNFDRGDSKILPKRGGNWQQGRLTDLTEWQTYFRAFNSTPEGKTNGFPVAAQPQTPAADVLLALILFNPAIEELRQAARRPQSRLPLDYDQGFDAVQGALPWFAVVKRCDQVLELRTVAELANGQSQVALDDLKLSLHVADGLRDQPFLISQLVRIAMVYYAVQSIYEGLAQHRWNDAQLADLDSVLTNENFLADYMVAMRGERTCAFASLESMRLTRQQKSFAEVSDGAPVYVTNTLYLTPSCYFYRSEIAFARMYQQFILPLADPTNRTVSLAAYRAGQQNFHEWTNHISFYSALALMTFPSICQSVERFALTQTGVDLARVGCALERYRLAHGEYPPTLDVLTPQYLEELPHDVITGQPLHYRRTDDGRFILYSVGWNEKDDGGTVFLTKSGSWDREQGDWVWQYPPK
jgi:hypothetical protein